MLRAEVLASQLCAGGAARVGYAVAVRGYEALVHVVSNSYIYASSDLDYDRRPEQRPERLALHVKYFTQL